MRKRKTKPVTPTCGRFTVHDLTWAIDITVLMGISPDKVSRILKKEFVNIPDISGLGEGSNAGRMWSKGNSTFVIWLPEIPSSAFQYSVLQHEIFHVADIALRGKGIVLNDSSDEAYAYLIQHLTAMIYTKLWSKRF